MCVSVRAVYEKAGAAGGKEENRGGFGCGKAHLKRLGYDIREERPVCTRLIDALRLGGYHK